VKYQNCLHPRHFLIWLFYLFIHIVSILPYRVLVLIGVAIGNMARIFSRKRKHIARINLKQCFPEMTDENREKILVDHFRSLGITLVELSMYLWPDERLKPLVKVEGLDHLLNALDKNKGVILLAAHFTTAILATRLLRLFTELYAVYRKLNNRCMDSIIKNEAGDTGIMLVPHDHLKTIIACLKNNIPMMYLPDQNFGKRQSIFVPFFGIPTATITATSRLAAINNSPVIPVFPQRANNHRGYLLTIGQPLENFPTDDLESDTVRINKLIEEQVRKNPADYLWIHRRFKTRPEGEPPIYQ
jgi:Kdo2-lipid IVA lauroyltransferase/acyltransferase